MARFIFNLEAALEQRKRVERDRQLVVARLEQQRVSVEERVRMVQKRLTGERDELRGMLAGGVVVGAVRMQSSAGLRGLSELRALAVELAGVLKRLESARRELLGATVERKAVDKLRERQFERWRSEQNRREAAELDDLTLMRAARTVEGGPGSAADEQGGV